MLVVGVAAVAFTAAGARAASADVFQQRGSLAGTFQDLNICSWPSTFTVKGQFYFEAVGTGDTLHITYHETANYTVVIGGDPSVPAAFRNLSAGSWSAPERIPSSDGPIPRIASISADISGKILFRLLRAR